MRHPDDGYQYDEDYDGGCEVLAESGVDQWAGTDLETGECEAKATWVVFEEDYDEPAYVCELHAKAWVQHGDTLFSSELNVKPVTDDEVQAAIASILGAVS